MLNTDFIREVGPFRWALRTGVRQFYKRVIKREHRMRLPTGEWLGLPLSSKLATEAFVTNGNVDWGSEKLLYLLIEGRGSFLDVGANIGYYSLYLLPRSSTVYSFEPDPRARKMLERNVSGKSKIQIVPIAVGACEAAGSFVLEKDCETSHLSETGESAPNRVNVEITTIDAFVSARGLEVECIKIDAEGFDTEIITGALDVLARQKPIVLTEARPGADLFALMGKVGYRVFAFVRDSKTRRRFFRELLSGVSASGSTKMLFLVPEHFVPTLLRNAAIC